MVNKPVDSPNPNPKKKERFRGPHSHKKKVHALVSMQMNVR